jgi:hypothetical protein
MSTSLSNVSQTKDESGQNEVDEEELRAICSKLERASDLLGQLAQNGHSGAMPSAEALSAALALILNARSRIYADQRPDLEGSARERILIHLQRNEGQPVSAAELAEVSGIRAWERRVRELREGGYDVVYLGSGIYRLNPRP